MRQRRHPAAARANSGAGAPVIRYVILGQEPTMSTTDVQGQTRPRAEKQPSQRLLATQILRKQPEVSRLKPGAAPGLISVAYADQLTSGSATLQSP